MPTLSVAIDSRAAVIGANNFISALGRMEKATTSFDRAMRTLVVGLSAITVISKAIDIIRHYDFVMQELRGVTQATNREMELFNKQARQLAATTMFSADQAAKSLLNFSKAGFSVQESLDATPGALSLAQAHVLDLGQATDWIVNTLKQFNLEAKDTNRVVDAMSKIANITTIDVQRLAGSLKFIGGIANAAGHSLEETNAAIGVLGQAGIKGFLAGTSLRGIYASLQKPTNIARSALEEMSQNSGVSLKMSEIDPAMNKLVDIMERLYKAGLNTSYALRIFGREQANAALQLSQNTELMRQYTDAQVDAQGETKKLADTMQDSVEGSLKRMVNSFNELFLTMGDNGVKKGLRGISDSVGDVLFALAGMNDAIKGSKATAQNLAHAFETVLVSALLLAVIPAINATIRAFNMLKAAMASNPFGLLAVVLSTLIAEFIVLRNEVWSLGEATDANGEVVQKQVTNMGLLSAAWEQFILRVKMAVNSVSSAFNVISGYTQDAADWFWMRTSSGKGAAALNAAESLFSVDEVRRAAMPFTDAVVESAVEAQDKATKALKEKADKEHNAARDALNNSLYHPSAPNAASDPNVMTDEQKAGWLQLDKIIEKLQEERDVLGENAQATAQVRLVNEAMRIARKNNIDLEEQWINLLKEEIELTSNAKATYWMDEKIKTLREETALIGVNETARSRALLMREAEKEALRNATIDMSSYVKQLNEQFAAQERAKANDWMSQQINSIEDERSVIMLDNEAREDAIKLREAERVGLQAGVKNLDEWTESLRTVQRLMREDQVSKWFSDRMKSILDDRGLIGMTDAAKEVAQAWREAMDYANARNVDGSGVADQIASEVTTSQQMKMNDQMQVTIRSLQDQKDLIGLVGKQHDLAAQWQEDYNTALQGGAEDAEAYANQLGEVRKELLALQGDDWFKTRLKDLQFEQTLVMKTNAEREISKELYDAENTAIEYGLDNREELLGKMREELTLLHGMRATKVYNDYIKSLNEQKDVIMMTNEQRQIAIALQQTQNQMLEEGRGLTEQETAAITQHIELMQRMQELKNMSDAIGVSMASALGDLIISGKQANEVMQDLLVTLYRIFYDELVGKAMANFVSGAFSSMGSGFIGAANGRVFSDGRVVPLASGGIYHSPTMRPMADGATALFGEAGPEAVMPLRRMANGRLGVEATSGHGGAAPVVVNITVHATDANSFRASKQQIAAAVHQATSSAMRTR